MSNLHMTRRSFLKAAAVTGAAAALACVSSPGVALADYVLPVEEAKNGTKVIRSSCRGCGKMECSVWVTVTNGRAIRIEGDDSSVTSNGNCCTKSQSSLQAAYHPDRIHTPLIRTNEKLVDDPGWRRATYEEACGAVAKAYLQNLDKWGVLGAMTCNGTSRQWGSITGQAWSNIFQTGLNNQAAAQICKGPRRLSGCLTIDNAMFWCANVDFPRVYIQWGTDQTQSNYDDSCRTIAAVSQAADVFISIDPRTNNCGKEADFELRLRPGSDVYIAMAWTRLIIDRELYDDYLVKYWSNAPFLICKEIDATGWTDVKCNLDTLFDVRTRLLKESDLVEGGDVHKFALWNNAKDGLTFFQADENHERAGLFDEQDAHHKPTTGFEYRMGGFVPDYTVMPDDLDPALWCDEKGFPVTLKDGRQVYCRTVWQEYWDRCVKDITLEYAAQMTEVPTKIIEESCMAWVTRFDERHGNGGLNAQLGPEQTGWSIQFFRTVYLLDFMTDNYDTPGGSRGPTRGTFNGATFPMYTPSGQISAMSSSNSSDFAQKVVKSTMEERSVMTGVDRFPLTQWGTMWTDATSLWDTVHTDDPYAVRFGAVGAGDFMNQSNATYAWDALHKLDFFLCCDLWHNPISRAADVYLPGSHWLEIPGWPKYSQGAGGGSGLVVQCIEPVGGHLFEGDAVRYVCKAMNRPFYDPAKFEDVFDTPWAEVALDQWAATTAKNTKAFKLPTTWKGMVEEYQKHGWWNNKILYPEEWGTYRRYMMGYLRNGKKKNAANKLVDTTPGMGTPTMKCEFWSTIVESVYNLQGRAVCNEELPHVQEPPMSPISTPELFKEYPFNMTTGRRIPVYFHNEQRQLPWQRELWPAPRMEIHPDDAKELGLEQGDWAWIESKWGKVRQTVDLFYGVKRGVINCEHQWWFPELDTYDKGFQLCGINCINNKDAQDPLCGSSQLRAIPVKVYKATPENSPFGNP
ncbi:MAG: molybdopterin-dependent oxidoreductase, partial [Coriobacteriales bacterium]|nr:molybdopterin-dependent oxidoreductase [Coriobacteriales bacterium]